MKLPIILVLPKYSRISNTGRDTNGNSCPVRVAVLIVTLMLIVKRKAIHLLIIVTISDTSLAKPMVMILKNNS